MNSEKFSNDFVCLCLEVAKSYNDRTAARRNRLRKKIDNNLIPAAIRNGIDVDKGLMALLDHKHESVRFQAAAALLRSKSDETVRAGEKTLRALVDESHPEAWDVGLLAKMLLHFLAENRRRRNASP